jgi:Leucine-rich repeat (LRR) protein
LEELDLQYNNIDALELINNQNDNAVIPFPNLDKLHISYNKIPPGHLIQLSYLPNLKILEIASNDFCTLPSDLSGFKSLEELNLSSNNFSSDSVLVTASKLFLALSTIRKLKKLNLSRNKFKRFHSEDLPQDNIQLAEEEDENLEDPISEAPQKFENTKQDKAQHMLMQDQKPIAIQEGP